MVTMTVGMVAAAADGDAAGAVAFVGVVDVVTVAVALCILVWGQHRIVFGHGAHELVQVAVHAHGAVGPVLQIDEELRTKHPFRLEKSPAE